MSGAFLRGDIEAGVSVDNPDGVLYIKGDEFTDESLRLILIAGITHIEKRETGVWNSTRFELGNETLLLGHGLALSALGNQLQVTSVEGERDFLPLTVPFQANGTNHPQTPVVGPLTTRLVIQPDTSVDDTSTSHVRQIIVGTFAGFGRQIYLKVGAVAATADVRIEFTEGLTPGGTLVFARNYPASEFPANTEVLLSVGTGVAFAFGETALMTVSSPVAFGLEGDGTEMFFAMDFQVLTTEDVVSENLILSSDHDILFDTNFDPIYTNPVFG